MQVEALVDKSYKNFIDRLNDALKVTVFVKLCPVLEKQILVYGRYGSVMLVETRQTFYFIEQSCWAHLPENKNHVIDRSLSTQ